MAYISRSRLTVSIDPKYERQFMSINQDIKGIGVDVEQQRGFQRALNVYDLTLLG